MSTGVFIWDNHEHTGHASILIKNQYVSFHPNFSRNISFSRQQIIAYNRYAHKKVLKIIFEDYPPICTNFTDDVDGYGHAVDVVKIDTFDEDGVCQYIENGLFRDHPKYNLLRCNCSSIVATLLFLGKHEYLHDTNFVATMIVKMRHMKALRYEDEDLEVRNYHDRRYEKLEAQLKKVLMPAFAIAKRTPIGMAAPAIVAGLDFAFWASFWTPGDVLHLALYLRDHPNR